MSLKIALVGYGKMGRAVEAEAVKRGHTISHKIDQENNEALHILDKQSVDVVIEFTEPETAISNFRTLLAKQIPVVSGTTGWYESADELKQFVAETESSFLYASNFSPGVNILFQLNKQLAKLMNAYPEYDVLVDEKHHRNKKDAPSGTAISLGKQVLDNLDRKSNMAGAELEERAPTTDELSMSWSRSGNIIGEHTVRYVSEVDEININHIAHDRRGFALGAVMAAEWLHGKKGFYNFAEIFEQ